MNNSTGILSIALKIAQWICGVESMQEVTWRCYFQRIGWFLLRLLIVAILAYVMMTLVDRTAGLIIGSTAVGRITLVR